MLGILVNWVLRRVAPAPVSMGLIMLSFLGVATVITKGDFTSLLQNPGSYGANTLIILGALCWVIYTVGASFFPTWSPYKYTAVTTALGMTSVLPLNALILALGLAPMPSASDFVFVLPHVLYMAIVAGFIGVLCWNMGNKILTPLNGTLFMDVVPITAFVVSAVMGVAPTGIEIAGACLTGLALIVNNLYVRHRMAQAARANHTAAPVRSAAQAVAKPA
jgi:drug/metabolite transporter (DMT)-like permease